MIQRCDFANINYPSGKDMLPIGNYCLQEVDSMNKLTQAIALSGVTFFSGLGPVLAATDSVGVTANIAEVVSLGITPNANLFAVTAGTAVTNQDIATISINSNDPDGYDVTLSGGKATSVLANVAADETIAYTVSYAGGVATGLTTTPTNVENVTTQTAGVSDRSLTLTIAGEASIGRSAEAFTDTITVTIVGK